MLAGAGVIAGGTVVAIGSRLAWVTVNARGSPVNVPGFRRVVFASGLTFDAASIGAGYLFGLGLLLALVPLGWLVTGPRARVALALVALAAAIGIMVATAHTRSRAIDRATIMARSELSIQEGRLRVATSGGSAVTAAGAALAALAAIGGAVVGGSAPRLGLPERPPAPPDQNGQR
jgi:hypothetical protein